jgi:cytochrome c peroxidase
MQWSKKQIILCLLCLVLIFTVGLAVTVAESQTVPQNTPGISIISRIGQSVVMLQKILTGNIPATINQNVTLPDPTGWISTYQPGGATTTSDNAFFSSRITTNGRSCFTCHQPQNGWEISPPQILAQYLTTRGQSALFQPIDAADCPDSPGATARFPDPRFLTARTQLFNRGNFRISLNAPNPLGPQAPDPSFTTFGGNTNPEWILTVVYDPFGCELDPVHGLPANLISVYRRPLPSANVAFLQQYHNSPNPAKFEIMWDAREPNLESQFINATLSHGQTTMAPDPALVTQGVLFQSGMFTAQSFNFLAGDLTGGDGSGASGGPTNLYDWRQTASPACTFDATFGLTCPGIKVKQTLPAPVTLPDGTILVDSSNNPKSLSVNVGTQLYDPFATATTRRPLQQVQRKSIARGEALFSHKVFNINMVAGLNDIKGDPNGTEPGTCTTCHSNKNVLNDTAGDPKRLGIMDNSSGVTVMPWTSDFPRFAFYCTEGTIPFFSNPVASANCPGGSGTCDMFITTDPGKGLITGKCKDLGKMKVPILRGLASRAPYFHGGNAATLLDVVNFYNLRFDIRLTDREKSDLVNYLSSL